MPLKKRTSITNLIGLAMRGDKSMTSTSDADQHTEKQIRRRTSKTSMNHMMGLINTDLSSEEFHDETCSSNNLDCASEHIPSKKETTSTLSEKKRTKSLANLLGRGRMERKAMDQSSQSHATSSTRSSNATNSPLLSPDTQARKNRRRRRHPQRKSMAIPGELQLFTRSHTTGSVPDTNPRRSDDDRLQEFEAFTNELERLALALGKAKDPEKILRKHVNVNALAESSHARG